jgi:hypothetical protein
MCQSPRGDAHARREAQLRVGTLVERDRLAAFVLDEATAFAANPFPSTTAGAARQRWGLSEIEFEAMRVDAAGLPCLMAALARLPPGEPQPPGDPVNTGPCPLPAPPRRGRPDRRGGATWEAARGAAAIRQAQGRPREGCHATTKAVARECRTTRPVRKLPVDKITDDASREGLTQPAQHPLSWLRRKTDDLGLTHG